MQIFQNEKLIIEVITAPVERTTSEEYPTILGGEIWYN